MRTLDRTLRLIMTAALMGANWLLFQGVALVLYHEPWAWPFAIFVIMCAMAINAGALSGIWNDNPKNPK